MNDWRDNIRRVNPYVPGEQPKESNRIKLNTNESPYPPSPKVMKALRDIVSEELRCYPDPTVEVLVRELADYHGVNSEQIFAGVGSDDVIALCFLAFYNSFKPILFPDITYLFYEVWADLYDIPYRKIELDNDFNIIKEDYLIENGGIILPNPNAPTGIALTLTDIEYIVANNQESIVIIDEAYIDYGGESAITIVNRYDNLIIVRTFSKSRSMAGARVGYAVGSAEIISYLNDIKYSFNSYTINSISMKLAVESLKDEIYFRNTIAKTVATRSKAIIRLNELGFVVMESSANFVFVKHKDISASSIYDALRMKNIFVRYFNKPRIDNYLRITIGTDEEMEHLYEALELISREGRKDR